jgi:mono/diheme cytochrome c family protein
MNMLAPEPTVNKGSDDVLSQLSAETTSTIKAGATVYHNHCAHCHGAALQGQPNWNQPDANGMLPAPPHDDSGHTWHHADDQLFEFVKYGPATAMGDPQYRSMMPAFQNVLSDSEIDAVLVFIRSTWSSERKEWQRGANDAQTGNVWWKKE